jgi:hypothetical protein
MGVLAQMRSGYTSLHNNFEEFLKDVREPVAWTMTSSSTLPGGIV